MERVLLWAAAEEERLENVKRIDKNKNKLRETSLKFNQPMLLPENSFIDNFRLTKDVFRTLCNDLGPYLKVPQRSTAVPPEMKVLAALQYYAFGKYQRNVGSYFNLGIAQQTVSDCLAEIFTHPDILRKYIKFPSAESERLDVSRGFYDKFKFPGVMGCIDGTHIAIIGPSQEKDAYYNINKHHSLNVMVICDANLRILHCDASFGGATVDSYIFDCSPIKREMERIHKQGHSYWLLGDSAYAQSSWMMTPILNAAPDSPEEHYNTCHESTRKVVEQCLGVLKSRFCCLSAHRVMHYDPIKAGKIFYACAVLHNLIDDPSFTIDDDEMAHGHQMQSPRPPVQIDNLDVGRADVLQRLWKDRSASILLV